MRFLWRHRLTIEAWLIGLLTLVAFAGPALAQARPDPKEWAERAAVTIKAWKDCLAYETIRYAAQSTEPAETVVVAARGSCTAEEVKLGAVSAEWGLDPSERRASAWESQRPGLISLALEARARQAILRKRKGG